MICETCRFKTQRLLVGEWHSLPAEDWTQKELSDVVIALLTEGVTRSLPTSWQGAYSVQRAREWIQERDSEGTTLLAVDRSSRMAIGLVILSESVDKHVSGTEVRLGYMFSECVWGKGIASELVKGFVEWCRMEDVVKIVSGVARDNIPSRRVLEKAGFTSKPCSEIEVEQFFELYLRPN
jgi:[ribosomal protein S5]-alanine N-acetyltransferase